MGHELYCENRAEKGSAGSLPNIACRRARQASILPGIDPRLDEFRISGEATGRVGLVQDLQFTQGRDRRGATLRSEEAAPRQPG
jgi:hypothetical protein